MLFTAVIHKLKLHQIDLASLRCECASERATPVATANALATGVTQYLKLLIGVGLYFQLWKVLQRCAVDRFVECGYPAEHLAPAGIHYSPLHIHALVGIRCAPDRKLYWEGGTRRFHDDLGVLRIGGHFVLAQLDTVLEQTGGRVSDVGFTPWQYQNHAQD